MAVYYIDFSATFNGNGSAPTQAASDGAAGAYNVSPTLTAGNTYRYKRGTTYTEASPASTSPILALSLTATAAAPTVIEAYYNDDGTDDETQPRPVIDHNGGGNGQACVRLTGCQYVIVRNIAGTNSILSGGSAVRVRNSSDVTVSGCLGYVNTVGISVVQDTSAATMSRITISDSEVYGNVCGILYTWMDSAGSYIDDLTIDGNVVRDNDLTPGVNRYGGIQHGASNSSTTVTNSDRGVRGIAITNNEVYGNRGYALTTYGARSSSTRPSRIASNHVYGNNPLGLVDAHAIWVGASSNTIVEDNRVHGNTGLANGTSGSQVGIFMDFNSVNTAIVGASNIVRRNIVYDGWMGPSQVTSGAGAGIYLLNQTGCLVESNVIHGCATGINIDRDTPAAPAHVIRNNTIFDITGFNSLTGVGILVNVGNNHTIYNNIISGCSLSGLFVNSALTGVTESYNCIYDSNVPYVVSAAFTTLTPGVMAASDLTDDPLIDERLGYLLAGSPLIGNGMHSGYRTDATRRVMRHNPPSIGAYEYVTARPTRTLP